MPRKKKVSQEEIHACMVLICKMAELSKNLKRVNLKEKKEGNENDNQQRRISKVKERHNMPVEIEEVYNELKTNETKKNGLFDRSFYGVYEKI